MDNLQENKVYILKFSKSRNTNFIIDKDIPYPIETNFSANRQESCLIIWNNDTK